MAQNIKIKEILDCIESVAPLHWQEDYDNAGIIIGNKENYCTGVYVCLDVFSSEVDNAIQKNCNLIISHHPFIFRGIKKFHHDSETVQIISKALKHDITIYSAHTNMDSSAIGVNFALAKQLNLKTILPLDNSRYPDNADYLGQGAIGLLSEPMNAKQFLLYTKQQLNLPHIDYIGQTDKVINRIGFCGGAGSFLIEKAIDKGCELFLTGDLKYHDFLTYESKIILANIGHFGSEQFIKRQIIDIISKKICNFAPLYESEEKNRVKFL